MIDTPRTTAPPPRLPLEPILPLRVLLVTPHRYDTPRVVESFVAHAAAVEIISHAAEARLALEHDRFDMIVVDWDATAWSASVLVEDVRTQPAYTRNRRALVIGLTAHPESAAAARTLGGGLDHLLPKPVTSQAVRPLLECAAHLNAWSDTTPLRKTARAFDQLGPGPVRQVITRTQPSVSPIDWPRLEELTDGTPGDLAHLLETVLRDLRRQFEDVRHAACQGLWPTVARLAHAAAATSVHCGLPALSRCFQHLESMSDDASPSLAEHLVAQASGEMARIQDHLRALRCIAIPRGKRASGSAIPQPQGN